MNYSETRTRAIIKAVTWRVTATTDTVIIAFFITGTIKDALSIGVLELLTKGVFYYVHERIWNKSNFGRKGDDTMDYQI